MAEKQYNISDLVFLMDRLRNPETGCPWDLKQSFQSITPYTLEEAYEVVDAIEKQDYEQLKEELGDLLLQVIFYSQLAKEENLYELDDVIDHLVKKLVRRHPHVFPDQELYSEQSSKNKINLTSEEVKQTWDVIKQNEKQQSKEKIELHVDSVLDDVPLAFPGLVRAEKLQQKAASLGFDWPDAAPILHQLKLELMELEEVLEREEGFICSVSSNQIADNSREKFKERLSDELGDVMFSVVNLARHHNLDSEQIMRKSNEKFEQRFRIVEKKMLESGKPFESFELDELEGFWKQAKFELMS